MTAENLLDIARVAELLHLSRSFTYGLVQKGDIPSLRIGRLIRVRESDLEAYIRRRRVDHVLTPRATVRKLGK